MVIGSGVYGFLMSSSKLNNDLCYVSSIASQSWLVRDVYCAKQQLVAEKVILDVFNLQGSHYYFEKFNFLLTQLLIIQCKFCSQLVINFIISSFKSQKSSYSLHDCNKIP